MTLEVIGNTANNNIHLNFKRASSSSAKSSSSSSSSPFKRKDTAETVKTSNSPSPSPTSSTVEPDTDPKPTIAVVPSPPSVEELDPEESLRQAVLYTVENSNQFSNSSLLSSEAALKSSLKSIQITDEERSTKSAIMSTSNVRRSVNSAAAYDDDYDDFNQSVSSDLNFENSCHSISSSYKGREGCGVTSTASNYSGVSGKSGRSGLGSAISGKSGRSIRSGISGKSGRSGRNNDGLLSSSGYYYNTASVSTSLRSVGRNGCIVGGVAVEPAYGSCSTNGVGGGGGAVNIIAGINCTIPNSEIRKNKGFTGRAIAKSAKKKMSWNTTSSSSNNSTGEGVSGSGSNASSARRSRFTNAANKGHGHNRHLSAAANNLKNNVSSRTSGNSHNNSNNNNSTYYNNNNNLQHPSPDAITEKLRRNAWLEYSCADIAMNEREGEYFDLVEKAAATFTEKSNSFLTNEKNGRSSSSSSSATSPHTGNSPHSSSSSSDGNNNGSNHRRQNPSNSEWVGSLDKDIRRTFPKHTLFKDRQELQRDDDNDDGNNPANNNNNDTNNSIGVNDPAISNSSSSDDAPGGSGGSKNGLVENFYYFGEVARFSVESGGQASLRRLLHAYSMYDPQVGYCQGMNFITAMFLTVLHDEEESFWMLVQVMNSEPYHLRNLFRKDMAGTQEALYVAERLIKKFLPELYRHFQDECVDVSMFLIPWLMTVFTRNFPFELVLRVWDAFLFEGWRVVYRTMLGLLSDAKEELLEMGFEGILGYLGECTSKVDGPRVMASSLKIPLKHKHVYKYQKEWRALGKKNGGIGSVITGGGEGENSGNAATNVKVVGTVKRVYRNIVK